MTMASICLTCPGLGFSRSTPSKRTRHMAKHEKQIYITQPTIKATTTYASTVRRSANYPPSLWSYDYLQSLTNNYVGEKYETRSDTLKECVRTLISNGTGVEDPLSMLELVDDLERLGISYHFKEEISSVLKMIYIYHFKANENWNKSKLNLKALGFRLLRQHGYHIPQEIFEDIKDENGNIKANVQEDVVGMLNLYEASFLAVEDEKILDEAREFTNIYLKEKLEKKNIGNESMLMLVSHALELPLVWRPPRFEAIWFIEAYKSRSDMKPLLLELAELDFNIVQGIHQEDLKDLSRWWEALGWNKKLSFARDRLVESFMWTVGVSYQPSMGVLRKNMTKIISLVNVIDDIYDVYGTLDELEQFTDIVRRWDINAIEELPDYMKICFLGFRNTINEMACHTLTNQELLIKPCVKKMWVEYCEANLLEAQWFNNGYTPTLEEYLKNSCITISLPVIISNLYFFTSNIGEAPSQNVVQCSALILRLADDLGTSMAELKRGDVPKSIQCYMHETGASEEKARGYIKNLIMDTWKKLNKERITLSCPTSQILVECATNLGRMAQFTYQYADVFGTPDDWYKSQEISLIFNPKS
ncbi:putative lyase [Helianthus debilis subsp. tardiflorus]